MISARKVGISVAATAVAALVLLVAAWAVDAAMGGGQVRRNVHVANADVGGLDPSGLVAVVERLSQDVAGTTVRIDVGGETLETDLGRLGISLDADATAQAALDAGDGGFVLFRPFGWLASFVTTSQSDLRLRFDESRAKATMSDIGEDVVVKPVEPTLAYRDGALRTEPGRPGSRMDQNGVLEQLRRIEGSDVADRLDKGVIELNAALASVAPSMSDDSASELLSTVRERLAVPFELRFGSEVRVLDAVRLEPYLRAQLADDGDLVVDLEDQGTLSFLSESFADVGAPAQEPLLAVEDGKVVIGQGTAGTRCCGSKAVDALAGAIEAGETTVDLALAPRPPQRDTAFYQALGIKEEVATFTTNHPCCAPRVTNIHRMADIVGGRVLAPGETFSLNDTVGRRTRDNGFVAAPVINGDGNFDEDVGGGVSQFSTTLFNAAFFGGLEIDEYMAHGLYISRYPYGREATLSFPELDLTVRNNTPYGVLIWPSYTATSITVTLYSTKHYEVIQSDQREFPYGAACTQVTTYRTRTLVATGVAEIDKFFALYAPAEGVQCDGSVRPKPGETTPTAPPAPPPNPTAPSVPPPGPGPAPSTPTAPAATTTTTTTSTTAGTTGAGAVRTVRTNP